MKKAENSAPNRPASGSPKARDERQDRLKRLELIKSLGLVPYADRFEKTHSIAQTREAKMGAKVATAGRIVLFRDMGKVSFAHLLDFSGKVQIVLKIDELGQENYKNFIKIISLGDFIGVRGEMFKTQKGEISILVKEYAFLSKALRPLPEKWHGLKDLETKYRKRYLDLIANSDTMARFNFRSNFIWELRKFYQENGFLEIDTPVLSGSASGALAKPFQTHYNALDLDVYLRIAPEIHLKEAVAGGFEKIFEVARVFRNEGMDASHLQEFSMVEHYAAYWNFEDNMNFTEKMLTTLIKKLKGSLKIKVLNRDDQLIEVDFSLPWRRVSFRDLLMKDCGIDVDKCSDAKSLREAIKKKKIAIEDMDKLGHGNLMDALYKKISRPKIINPTFLINHPTDLSPLARKNDKNPLVTDRFQLIVNGWEIVNAYSELIDPIDQRERFEKQTVAKKAGDEEAMQKDDEFVEAMEYGMPPVSGWGMGIERIVALLTEQPNLRDVVMFPLLKPKE
ncbi:MAG TPA: lysine--tRNA ligase [Candidatus Paceibacterota bacterium]|nr:lysine--tRNA ligase [Candidatus Paceibacterota bacterium]HRZ34412.1 lysine--tRNA ligase [Candidatus Paceibacterota bacterium]